MIVDRLIEAIVTVLGAMFSLLPTGTLGIDVESTTFLQEAGNWGSKWDILFPGYEILTMLRGWWLVVPPVVIAYKIANWTYKHIPQIGGFGPGSG